MKCFGHLSFGGTLSSVLGTFSSRHNSRYLGMIQAEQKNAESAFTLVEMMVVVAVIGLLAAIAMFSYAQFIKRSQAVEADMALAEVTRLEELYFSATGTYSSDLNAIGFTPNPPLQYYRVSVRAVNSPDGSMFQATADPRSGTEVGQARSVARYADNQSGEKKSGDGGVSAGQTRMSTVTSAGSVGSGASVGGDVNDELSEQIGGSSPTSQQGTRIVEHGKPTGPAMSVK
jgi:type IV pilus assembly protein PilE